MKRASILLLLAIYTGARGALEGGCGRAGALRCDADGRHVNACTKGGAWRRVLDCGDSHAACVDGRCVPQLSSNVTRADGCTPGTWRCKDCEKREYCTAAGNWVDVGNCGGDVCICGECKPAGTYQCSNPLICSASAVLKKFHNPLKCQEYFFCGNKAWEPAPLETVPCQPGFYYNACESECTSTTCWENIPCDRSNNGQFFVFNGNPSKYYLCADGLTVLYKCNDNYVFYPTVEDCLPPKVECSLFRGNYRTGKYEYGNIKRKHLTYDDCSTTGPNPSRCTPGETWSYPNNACKYYFCVSSTDVREITCSVNTKYDETEGKCVLSLGSCANM